MFLNLFMYDFVHHIFLYGAVESVKILRKIPWNWMIAQPNEKCNDILSMRKVIHNGTNFLSSQLLWRFITKGIEQSQHCNIFIELSALTISGTLDAASPQLMAGCLVTTQNYKLSEIRDLWPKSKVLMVALPHSHHISGGWQYGFIYAVCSVLQSHDCVLWWFCQTGALPVWGKTAPIANK